VANTLPTAPPMGQQVNTGLNVVFDVLEINSSPKKGKFLLLNTKITYFKE